MLMKLTQYELVKKWKSLRIFIFAYILIQITLTVFTAILSKNNSVIQIMDKANPDRTSLSIGIMFILHLMLSLFILFLPALEGIYRFDKDLGGNQSVLEHMLPFPAWKKISSKVIAVIISSVIVSLISAVSLLIYFRPKLEFALIENLIQLSVELFRNPLESILFLFHFILLLLLIYMLFLFSIIISRCFSRNNRLAGFISVLTLIASVTVLVVISNQLTKLPVLNYKLLGIEFNVIDSVFSVISFAGIFYASCWLMERRIEN